MDLVLTVIPDGNESTVSDITDSSSHGSLVVKDSDLKSEIEARLEWSLRG